MMVKGRLHTVPLAAAAESHETIFYQQGPFSPTLFNPLIPADKLLSRVL